MAKHIIRALTWVIFLGLFALIINHLIRGLEWMPLTLLLVPVSGMLWFTEGGVE